MKKSGLIFLVLLLTGAGLVRADQTIVEVQQALKEQGFYYGDVTGTKTADTTAAIRRYQIRNGLQITGEIDAETLRSLGVGAGGTPSTAARQPAPVQTSPPGSPDQEEDVQSAEVMPSQPGNYPPGNPPPQVATRRSVNEVFLGNWGQQLVPKPKLRTFVRLFTLVPPGFAKAAGYLLQRRPSAVLSTLLRRPTAL